MIKSPVKPKQVTWVYCAKCGKKTPLMTTTYVKRFGFVSRQFCTTCSKGKRTQTRRLNALQTPDQYAERVLKSLKKGYED